MITGTGAGSALDTAFDPAFGPVIDSAFGDTAFDGSAFYLGVGTVAASRHPLPWRAGQLTTSRTPSPAPQAPHGDMDLRRLLTFAALTVAAVVLAAQVRLLLADPTIWPPDDFIEYWAAAKLTLAGENPYDPARLLPLQRANGRDTDEAVMMWNPPWSLAVVLPLGLLPAREAQLLWLTVNLAAVGFCGDRLWRLLGGNRNRRWVGWLVAFAALPTLFALQSGQIGPLLLLGAVLFLDFRRRGWDATAGAATVLLAVKPHLAYLVWSAILGEAVTRNRWRTVLGGAAAGLVCSALPVVFSPQVWHDYADALSNRPPEQWVSPTLGTVLRLAFGEERFRLQFVPVVLGLAWFAWHWSRHRRSWDWTEQLPLLLLVSFVTAPYGAWPFDMVLLLPAAMRLVVAAGEDRARRRPVLGLLVVNLGCLVLNLLRITSFWFLWVSPAVLVLYITGTRPEPRPGGGCGGLAGPTGSAAPESHAGSDRPATDRPADTGDESRPLRPVPS